MAASAAALSIWWLRSSPCCAVDEEPRTTPSSQPMQPDEHIENKVQPNDPDCSKSRSQRGGAVGGSASELHLKHRLALNLRRLNGRELSLAPRSYLLSSDGASCEFDEFRTDFQVSHVLRVLQSLAQDGGKVGWMARWRAPVQSSSASSVPEGLWGREPVEVEWEAAHDDSFDMGSCIEIVLRLAQLLIVHCRSCGSNGMIVVSTEDWKAIRGFGSAAAVCSAATAAKLPQLVQLAVELLTELRALAAEVTSSCTTHKADGEGDTSPPCTACAAVQQLTLLEHNVWLLKPSNGQAGRGILIIRKLPSSVQNLLSASFAAGRGGKAKRANDVREV